MIDRENSHRRSTPGRKRSDSRKRLVRSAIKRMTLVGGRSKKRITCTKSASTKKRLSVGPSLSRKRPSDRSA